MKRGGGKPILHCYVHVRPRCRVKPGWGYLGQRVCNARRLPFHVNEGVYTHPMYLLFLFLHPGRPLSSLVLPRALQHKVTLTSHDKVNTFRETHEVLIPTLANECECRKGDIKGFSQVYMFPFLNICPFGGSCQDGIDGRILNFMDWLNEEMDWRMRRAHRVRSAFSDTF